MVGAFASGYAGYYFGNQPEDNTVLEYNKITNKNLKNILGGVNGIKITYEDKELEKVSNSRYTIINNTDKNLDKFKLYFEVTDNNLPLFHSITPPESYPKEAITLISKNNGIYIFEVEYLNNTTKVWDGLDFTFYFSGSEPPEIKVKTGSKGIQIREYKYKERSTVEFFIDVVMTLWWLLSIYFILAYLVLKLGRVRRNLHKEQVDQTLIAVIKDNNELSHDEKIEKIKSSIKDSPSFSSVINNWNKSFEA
jgi:hypothetical protein